MAVFLTGLNGPLLNVDLAWLWSCAHFLKPDFFWFLQRTSTPGAPAHVLPPKPLHVMKCERSFDIPLPDSLDPERRVQAQPLGAFAGSPVLPPAPGGRRGSSDVKTIIRTFQYVSADFGHFLFGDEHVLGQAAARKIACLENARP